MKEVYGFSKGEKYSDKLLLYFTKLLDQSAVVFKENHLI